MTRELIAAGIIRKRGDKATLYRAQYLRDGLVRVASGASQPEASVRPLIDELVMGRRGA